MEHLRHIWGGLEAAPSTDQVTARRVRGLKIEWRDGVGPVGRRRNICVCDLCSSKHLRLICGCFLGGQECAEESKYGIIWSDVSARPK